MHKHYTGTAFLTQNLVNQWFGAYAEKHDLLQNELTKIHPIGATIEDDQHAHLTAGKIAHTVVMDGYERLCKRGNMTGEWIIYYVHEGQNYYLDLACHVEQRDEQQLYDRLKRACAWEFPFAFE